MKPEYSISIDPSRGLLRLSLSGFFDMASLARFAAERNAAVARLGLAPNRHVTLCDISQQLISTKDIADAFRQVVTDPRYASRRLAIVMNNALARMQTQRVVTRENVRYFGTVAEAETWLFADAAEPSGDTAPAATAAR